MFSDRVPRELAANRLATTVADLRSRGRAFIDLTESNPTRAGFDYPPDLLTSLADASGLRYDPCPLGSLDARRAIASDYARQGVEVPPEHVVLTASTSDAYGLLFKLLADAGDDVLVPRPSYPLFDHLARLDLVSIRGYDLEYHSRWSIDVGSVERALGPRTRAVLLVCPNNPTGSFVSPDELDRLSALCAPRDIAIIADEVFADYELERGATRAAARASNRRDVLSFALGGLSKSIGLPQVKLGWMAVAGPNDLVNAALERLEMICDTYLSVSTPVQIAASDLLHRGAHVRSQIQKRVATNYRSLRPAVAAVPSCRIMPSDGGWYAVMQVPSLESEDDLVVRLLATDGVLVHPGYFFDFSRESFLIISLLPPPQAFADGVSRILRRFACHRP